MAQNHDTQQLSRKERKELKRQQKEAARKARERKKWGKKIGMWAASALVGALIIVGFQRLASRSATPPTDAAVPPIAEDDWVKGDAAAGVELIEYGDFQCPACGFYAPLVGQLHQDFGDSLAIAYRHFPLTTIHQNAELAAQAAEAAGVQGKFWEMHDMLFGRQDDWSNLRGGEAKEKFVGYAGDIGLDQGKFEEDLESDAVKDRVQEDLVEAQTAGLRGTPSFFLNGEALPNPRSYDEFKATIEAAIAAAANMDAGDTEGEEAQEGGEEEVPETPTPLRPPQQ